MNIATVASDTVWKDAKKNIEQTEHHVQEVLRLYPQTQVILFPELSLVGFVTDSTNKDVAEPVDGYSVTEVKRIARQYKVTLICGMIEKNGDNKPFNTQFVVSEEGKLLAKYHKNHLFTQVSETQLSEADVFTPGEELAMFSIHGWECGLSTCFDIRFPRLFETYRKAGVECIFSAFNWVHGRNKPAIMEHLVKARATENQFFFVAVDRTGEDPNTSYYGTSVVTNPFCEDIAERQGIYAYAELKKDDMASLRSLMPIDSSFKPSYNLQKEILKR